MKQKLLLTGILLGSLTSLSTTFEIQATETTIENSQLIQTTADRAIQYPTIMYENTTVATLKDSMGANHQIIHEKVTLDSSKQNILLKTKVKVPVGKRDQYYKIEVYKRTGLSDPESVSSQTFKSTSGQTEIALDFNIPIRLFNDQPGIYIRVAVHNDLAKDPITQTYYHVSNPYLMYLKTAQFRDVKLDGLAGAVGTRINVQATGTTINAEYAFQISTDNLNWETLQDFSHFNWFDYSIKYPNTHYFRVATREAGTFSKGEDFKTFTITGFPTITKESERQKLNSASFSKGQLTIAGYSYMVGGPIPSEKAVGRLIRLVNKADLNYVALPKLNAVKNTSYSTSSSHGNNVINYDYAGYQGVLDLTTIPNGSYEMMMENTYNAFSWGTTPYINAHSSIQNQSHTYNGRTYSLTRVGNKLELTIEPATNTEVPPTPDEIAQGPVQRVSKFNIVNNQIEIEGYSYVKGVNIPNSKDIIKKLKFTDVNTGKQVKTYSIPNVKIPSMSKDPNHGAGIYNYDWAKFAGTLDISDLPMGEYYLKIYTNAKDNKYDEVITFHSSIGDFSFTANGKVYQFERVKAYGVSSLKLTVS